MSHRLDKDLTSLWGCQSTAPGFPREVVGSLSLDIFKTYLDIAFLGRVLWVTML